MALRGQDNWVREADADADAGPGLSTPLCSAPGSPGASWFTRRQLRLFLPCELGHTTLEGV